MTESNQPEESTRDVIAVVGLAGRFPGAGTVSQFWNNLRAGVEAIREFSTEELRASGVPLAELTKATYGPKGNPARKVAAYWLACESGLKHAEVGKRHQMSEVGVSKALRAVRKSEESLDEIGRILTTLQELRATRR